jgi:hypothetical protein
MAAVDDVDNMIERFHLAQDEFLEGNPSLCRSCSHIQKT